uniref:Uncharacterized protein n=1 Tax=Romanomermis culicivorax TaxID=13658 RepID=A0A915KUL7_ROMCU
MCSYQGGTNYFEKNKIRRDKSKTDGQLRSACPIKSSLTMTTVTPDVPKFFCDPAKMYFFNGGFKTLFICKYLSASLAALADQLPTPTISFRLESEIGVSWVHNKVFTILARKLNDLRNSTWKSRLCLVSAAVPLPQLFYPAAVPLPHPDLPEP